MPDLDDFDRALLEALQEDARLTAQQLAERIALSPSQCARRRARLEAEGYITGYRATLDPARIGLAVTAFVQVSMAAHSAKNAADFRRLVESADEILDCWTMTGPADYLLRVAVADLGGLNRLVQEVLLPHPTVARVESRIVMDRLKTNAPMTPPRDR